MTPRSPSTRQRLNRFLARAGVGSRRRADELIAAGHVTINGINVTTLGTLVDPAADTVALDGRTLKPAVDVPIWIVFNKPAGTLTARRDARGRSTIYDHLPQEWRLLIPVGRLDYDTEGVLLLTSDGDGANRLMHPRYEVERIYKATIEGVPTLSSLRRLAVGIDLGDPTPARAQVTIVHRQRDHSTVHAILREGRKREVKRMMLAIGHRVLELKRVSFAGITARGLKPGQWRQLTATEVRRLSRVPGV
ncbi:MAG: pseudouridine synthase [Candidatus Zixiibacteriota bacterium]